MDDQKNGQAGSQNNGQQPDKSNKLDQWIEQTLQLGNPNPNAKIVHQPNPQQAGFLASNAQPHPAQASSLDQKFAQPNNIAPSPVQPNSAPKKEFSFPNTSPAPFQKPEPTASPKPQQIHKKQMQPQQPQKQNNHKSPHQKNHKKPQKNDKNFFKKPLSRFRPQKPAYSKLLQGKSGFVPVSSVLSPGSTANNSTTGVAQAAPQNPPPKKRFNPFEKLGFGRHKENSANQKAYSNNQRQPQNYQGKLRLIPFGGLNEVGKNCMILEYGEDILMIDLGYQFPEEDMLGVDYVIPDISYLEDKVNRLRGIVFTHGHLDHIGAVPYLLPKLNFAPMYGTKLTMGLVEKRLEEFGLQNEAKIHVITAEDNLQLGPFQVSFFAVNHSIPDAVGVVVKTPAGNIVHTGDFKFDHTPAGNQKPADFARIASLAYQDIGALFIDSTNALKVGHTITEKRIGESLESIIKNTDGRILIASFASQIGRIQQIIDAAKKHGRSIFLSGRSLIDNIAMASKLGYLNVPQGMIHDIRKVKKLPDKNALILTTGSQGEDVSALARIATEEHPAVQIKKGDTVVLSSSPIPGNERAVTTVTNNLCRLGAHVINNQIMDVHASGHAQQEDLKLMMSLVKPRYVVPVHGEYFMRYGNKEIAISLGYDEKHGVLIENGDVLEMQNNEVRVTGEKVQNNYILVDGLGVGDIGAQVIMDRQTLAENGVLIVMIPIDNHSKKLKGQIDVISRGFIYMSESEKLIEGIANLAEQSYKNVMEKRENPNRADIKKFLRESIDRYVHEKIERHPLVIPILVER